jgi:transposase
MGGDDRHPPESGYPVPGDSSRRMDPKKRVVAASERDADARAAWWAETLTLPVAQLVFVDETGTNTAMTPRYGWAAKGDRARGQAPRNHGPNVTLVTTLSLAGLGPAMVIDGPMTARAFEAFVTQLLVPVLHPGQIVILDNLSVHTGHRIRARIEAAGCMLRFLPPYSPDFSPIEWAFSKLKTCLRQVAARTADALDAAIAAGLAQMTAADARGWFTGCGYDTASQPL